MELLQFTSVYQPEPIVLALGNFDGVHIGHQELLRHGIEKAKELNAAFSVLLFDPHPLKALHPIKSMNLLTSQEERLKLFEKMGVQKVFLYPFTSEFAIKSPREFVEEILVQIGVTHVVVGFNYSFGHQGKGKSEDLVAFGQQFGFGVSIIQAQKIRDRIISSTEIRKSLAQGEISSAKEMMGRSPQVVGTVVRGDGRGRTIGFPTANLQMEEDLLVPKNGVYAVTSLINGKFVNGMMNIGVRPTFTEGAAKTIEIFFFDFQGDLYGKKLEVNIEHRLRPERKFESIDEMIRQLKKDQEETLKHFSQIQKFVSR